MIPDTILNNPVEPAAPPWSYQGLISVGELWAVGFAEQSDLNLVVLSKGRILLDCIHGEIVAHDPNNNGYNEANHTALGLGPLEGSIINITGEGLESDFEPTLPMTTVDGWSVEYQPLLGEPNDGVLLRPQGGKWVKIIEVDQVEAIGFSPTNRSLIVAEPRAIHVWSRPPLNLE